MHIGLVDMAQFRITDVEGGVRAWSPFLPFQQRMEPEYVILEMKSEILDFRLARLSPFEFVPGPKKILQ